MEPKPLYDYVLDQVLAVGLQVSDNDLAKPTPDTDWTIRELMQHMLNELVWIPDILSGKTIAEVGQAHDGDLFGSDIADSWREAVDKAREAAAGCDMVATAHLSYTDKPIGEYLLDSADDLLIHSWDLGQAVQVSVVFDENVAQTLYEHMSSQNKNLSNSGLFANSIPVPDSANNQTKLLALLGRDENWAEKA